MSPVDFIEIHAAHGYLIHSFLSPISNTRTDDYGGQSFENRIRFPLRIFEAVREAWGDRPLFVRLSATDWADGPEKDTQGKWLQWGVEQTILLTGELKKLGVDLIDVSSGGTCSTQKVLVEPGCQVRCSLLIKAIKVYYYWFAGSFCRSGQKVSSGYLRGCCWADYDTKASK